MYRYSEYDYGLLRQAYDLIEKVYTYNYDSSSQIKQLDTIRKKLDAFLKAYERQFGEVPTYNVATGKSFQNNNNRGFTTEYIKTNKNRLNINETYPTDTIYCVAYYDEDNDEYVGDAYDGVTLAAFDTLGNAESFEAWANHRKEEVDAFLASDDDYDDYDDEDHDSSPDEITVGELEEWLSEYSCVGCYHVSKREALKARQHEMVLDGQTVFILNQKDIGSDRLLSVDATPDRYER